jgi:putative transposase
MVAQPEDHVWSSFAHYIGRRNDRLITPHALYWSLGNTPFAREAAYAELVQAGITSDQQGALTDATLSGWALGDEAFKLSLQAQTERRLSKTKAGRPFAKGD